MGMKKLVSFLMALVMLLSLVGCGEKGQSEGGRSSSTPEASGHDEDTNPTSDATEDFLKSITAETAEYKGVCGADLTWYYQDNVLVIKGTGDMNDYRDSNSWEYPTNAPWGNEEERKLFEKIHWLIIDDGVTSIGSHAFKGCYNLVKADLANSITRIENSAFMDSGLTSLKLPSNIEYIGREAFWNCTFDNIILDIPASLAVWDAGAFAHIDGIEAVRLLGDTTELDSSGGNEFADNKIPCYCPDSSYDQYTAQYPEMNWVKE